MRMRGLEPPPSYLDTDLNRARLPIPPHPRADGEDSATVSAKGAASGQSTRVPLLASLALAAIV